MQATHRALAKWCYASATVACLLSGCKSDLPELTDANDGVGDDCTPYADLVVAFTKAGGADGSAEAEVVLGAPDEQSVTVATNEILTVGFVGLGGVIDMDGTDIRVHGSTSGEAAVYVGTTPSDLRYSGSLESGVSEVDIETATETLAIYVQVIGLSGSTTVDALESLQTVCGSALGVMTDPTGGHPSGRQSKRQVAR